MTNFWFVVGDEQPTIAKYLQQQARPAGPIVMGTKKKDYRKPASAKLDLSTITTKHASIIHTTRCCTYDMR